MVTAILDRPRAASPSAPGKEAAQARATTRKDILAEIERQEGRNWDGCSFYMDGCQCARCLAADGRRRSAWRELDALTCPGLKRADLQ